MDDSAAGESLPDVLRRRNQRPSLVNASTFSYDRGQSQRTLRDLLSLKVRPTAKMVEGGGIVIKKLDFFISQEEEPRLKMVKRDLDLEPEPLEDDYLVRLRLQFDTLPVRDIPNGVTASAKLFRWEESQGSFRKVGTDTATFGTLNYQLPDET